jgi:hypothetical protein
MRAPIGLILRGMATAGLVVVSPSCAGTAPAASSPSSVAVHAKVTATVAKGRPLAAPDGTRIAIQEPERITIYDARAAVVGVITPTTLGSPTFTNIGLRWLPDSSGLLAEVRSANQIGLVIVERDLTIRPLPLQNVGQAFVRLSPDGGRFAAEVGNDVVSFGRDGRATTIIASGDDIALIGWDDTGQLLVKDGASIRAVGPKPYTIQFPDGFPTERKNLAFLGSSPDGLVNVAVVRQEFARALFIVAGGRAHLGHGPMGWVGAHRFLTQHDGAFFFEDGVTGASQPAPGVPSFAKIKTEVGDRVVWSSGSELHITSAKADQIVADVPTDLETSFSPLGTGSLLIYRDGSLWVVELPGTT